MNLIVNYKAVITVKLSLLIAAKFSLIDFINPILFWTSLANSFPRAFASWIFDELSAYTKYMIDNSY